MNPTVAQSYRPFIELESKQLLFDLLHSPERAFDSSRRYAYSAAMSFIYGYVIPPKFKDSQRLMLTRSRAPQVDDERLVAIFHNLDELLEIVTSVPAALINFCSFFQNLPRCFSHFFGGPKQISEET